MAGVDGTAQQECEHLVVLVSKFLKGRSYFE
jgi:hypothetical protein